MPNPQAHFRQRWLVQLCTLLAFVLSLGWVNRASAAVPMCGVRAQTVAAPPIGTPASSDSLSAGACDEGAPLRAASVPQREAPEKLSFPDSPVRALPVLANLPSGPLLAQRSPAVAEHELRSTGFARTIDRPPRR